VVDGKLVICTEELGVVAARLPLISQSSVASDFREGGAFKFIHGKFVQILGGFHIGSLEPYAQYYERCLQNLDFKSLDNLIYPYRCNAFHYFALAANKEGLAACFGNVKFIRDAFNKTPLHYAIESRDKSVLEMIYSGIISLDEEERH